VPRVYNCHFAQLFQATGEGDVVDSINLDNEIDEL
jgi:hypothetical protein